MYVCGRPQKTKLKNVQQIALVKMSVFSFLIKNIFVKNVLLLLLAIIYSFPVYLSSLRSY